MVKWEIQFAKQAVKDARKISSAGLKDKTSDLLEILKTDPYRNPPPFEKLVGDLHGAYSRRISLQHRLVYEIFPEQKIVRILRMWTHYE